MEYQVVEAEYLVEIQDAVNEEIRKGWALQGGVAYNSNMGYYMQAMIKNKYTYDNVNFFRASPNPDSELKPVIASSGVAGGGGGGGVVKAFIDAHHGKDSSKPRWFEGINIKGIAEKPVGLAALTRLTGVPARAAPARAVPAQAAPARAAPARDSISDDDDIKSVYSESDEQLEGGSNKRKQKTKRSRMIKKRRTLRK